MAQKTRANGSRDLRSSARILDQSYRMRRRTIDLETDRSWLMEITPRPANVLGRMEDRGLVHRAGEGRFVIAPPGTDLLDQAAPAAVLIDLMLRPVGPYYIGFLSALISHHLTDLHSNLHYVAVPQGTRLRGRTALKLKLVQMSPSLWPAAGERERFRAIEGTKEFAHRSSLERTLVDGLLRPELSGGFETVAVAWARARDKSTASWSRVAEIADRLGDAPARRTALMLTELGLGPVAEQNFSGRTARSRNTPLDRSDSFQLPRSRIERDPKTGVLLNVPRGHLRGWLSGESG